jgi:hydroxypyruvate reductase
MLRASPWGVVISRILAAAIQAVEPAAAVRQHLRRDETTLVVGEQEYDLRQYERVFVVGAGKAGARMARAVGDVLGEYLTSGIVVVKEHPRQRTVNGEEFPESVPQTEGENLSTTGAYEQGMGRIALLPASHPLPDERGVAATQRIADLLEHTTERDLVLVLLSGGGSALLTLPPQGISLKSVRQFTSLLLAYGVTIHEMNSLRKHLDVVKGGGLARMAAPATVVTLVLSDVVGNSLDVIASGPTVPDSTTFQDVCDIMERYQLLEVAPPGIVEHFCGGLHGEVPENPRVGNPLFEKVQNRIVGSNQQAAVAALEVARAEGLNTMLLSTYMQGEARVAGQLLAGIARELATSGCMDGAGRPLLPRPACVVVGGETTVTLRGSGKGGRNQEVALAAVRGIAGLHDTFVVTLATDGDDGPTDAAGAVVTGETLALAQERGLNPEAALVNNDSYSFFAALGDLLRPGPTGTNVNDLAFVLVV